MLNHYGKTASFTTKVSGAGGGAACGGRGAAPCAPEPRRPAREPLEDQSPQGSSSGLPRPSRPEASARRHVQSHLAPAPPTRNPAWAFAESPGGLEAAGAPSSGRAGQAQDGRAGAVTALQGAAAPRPPHLALPRLPSFQPPAPPGGGGPTFTPRLVHGRGLPGSAGPTGTHLGQVG